MVAKGTKERETRKNCEKIKKRKKAFLYMYIRTGRSALGARPVRISRIQEQDKKKGGRMKEA